MVALPSSPVPIRLLTHRQAEGRLSSLIIHEQRRGVRGHVKVGLTISGVTPVLAFRVCAPGYSSSEATSGRRKDGQRGTALPVFCPPLVVAVKRAVGVCSPSLGQVASTIRRPAVPSGRVATTGVTICLCKALVSSQVPRQLLGSVETRRLRIEGRSVARCGPLRLGRPVGLSRACIALKERAGSGAVPARHTDCL